MIVRVRTEVREAVLLEMDDRVRDAMTETADRADRMVVRTGKKENPVEMMLQLQS